MPTDPAGTPPTPSIEERFARILREHGSALARLAGSYAHDRTEREDLLQEILLAIWTALPRFRGDCSERTFAFRIGHNRGLTYRARRRVPWSNLDQAAPVADPRADPEADASRAQLRDRLGAAVRLLPPPQREVIVLSLEGLSNREVADVLGTTENNVAVRLTRARKTLRVLLEQLGGVP